MKKNLMAMLLAAVMLFCAVPSFAYSVRDAYNEFVGQYPEFVNTVIQNGNGKVTEKLIIDFLGAIQRNLNNTHRFVAPITEENFDDALIDAVLTVSSADKYSPLQTALIKSYPDAIMDAATQKKVTGELLPIYEVVKSMIFEHDMLENIDSNIDNTVKLVSMEEIEAIDVSVGDSLDLPQWATVKSESGVTVKLEIDWTQIPKTTSKGKYTAAGVLVVPDGFKLDFPAEVSVAVNVSSSSDDGGVSSKPTGGTTRIDPITPSEPEEEKEVVHRYSFTDVDITTDAGKAIYALTDAGVITGYPDKTFKPSLSVNRAEFITMMVRALDVLNADAKSTFDDVPASQWYYAHVSSAVQSGLIKGYEDNTFRPANSITRGEVMTVLYRSLNNKKLLTATAQSEKFADDSAVPTWAKDYVYSLYANKIIAADKDGKIRAEQNATREDCAVMIYNALKAMDKIK